MYWETYLSDQTSKQTVISLRRDFGQNGISRLYINVVESVCHIFGQTGSYIHEIMTKTSNWSYNK